MKDETFVSMQDGTKIFVRSWRPQGPARAALVISHGFKAHSGLYSWAGEQFAKSGLSVAARSRCRGHGSSWALMFLTRVEHARKVALYCSTTPPHLLAVPSMPQA